MQHTSARAPLRIERHVSIPEQYALASHRHLGLKRLDIALMIVFPLVSVAIALGFHLNFLVTTLLFYGLPSVWMSIRTPHAIVKTGVFALLIGTPLTLIVDTLAVLDQSWYIPHTVFPSRLFGVVAYEQFIWCFVFVYAIVMTHEHFIHKSRHEVIDRRMKYILWPLLVAVIAYLTVMVAKPAALRIPYAYLWFGVVLLLLPAVTMARVFPRLMSKYAKITAYFFYLSMIYELTALQLDHWRFPGTNFVGWTEIGPYRFPLEELVFWMLLGAVGVMSFFDFFDNDPYAETGR